MDTLLDYFLADSQREFHVRELAKLSKKSPTFVSMRLAEFEKDGLLTSRKKLGHLLYRANTESQSFRDLKLFYNIKKLRESGVVDYLADKFNQPEAIILFGSFRKADDTPKSDIDILIITPAKKELNLEKFEKKLGHSMQIFAHSKGEIEKMKKKNKELFNNWINGICIYGFWEVFR